MNVTLPEKNKLKKKQIIIYTSIIIVCIICLVTAFYVQFYARISFSELLGISEKKQFGNKTEEEIEELKSDFNKVFINNIEEDNGDNDNKKSDKNQKLVYTQYEKKESNTNNYDLEIHIPHINIKSEIVDEYNKEIEDIFVNKARNVLQSENKNIIYTVEYVANVQDDILSLMIRSNLKEGISAQRIIIQTYNYDLRNNKEINLEEVLKIKNIDKSELQGKITDSIKTEQKKVEDLEKLGYNVYSRDVSNDIYKIENSKEFYLTNDTLYIIYAYGNDNFTSEIDLIVI